MGFSQTELSFSSTLKSFSTMTDQRFPHFPLLAHRSRPTRGEAYGFDWVEKYIPALGCIIAIATYVICFAITKICGVYTCDLIVPFFSDTGREGPGYVVFCIGLTITAITMVYSHWYIYRKVLSRKFYDRLVNAERSSGKPLRNLTWLVWI